MSDGSGRRREGLSASEARVVARRSDHHFRAHAELRGTRTYRGRRRDAPAAGTDRGRGRDAPTATTNGGCRGDVRTRARLVLACARIVAVDGVATDVRIVEIVALAVRVIGRVTPAPADGVAVRPVPARSERRPADVVVTRAVAPIDPRAGVGSTGDPDPAVMTDVRPATVMERRPTPRVVGDPDVVGVVRVGPVTRGRVRNEVGADLGLRRNPHGAVGGVVDPLPVSVERGLELGERAGIGVRVLRGIGAEGDVAGRSLHVLGVRSGCRLCVHACLQVLRGDGLGGLLHARVADWRVADREARLGLVPGGGSASDRQRRGSRKRYHRHDLRRPFPARPHRYRFLSDGPVNRNSLAVRLLGCNLRAASSRWTARRENQGWLRKNNAPLEVGHRARTHPDRRSREVRLPGKRGVVDCHYDRVTKRVRECTCGHDTSVTGSPHQALAQCVWRGRCQRC